MNAARLLIGGIGNIFLGDDAFGVEVARRLAGRQLPDDVRVVDFGIRGLDLAYALTDGYETAILVDAAPCGGPPGTLYVIEPETDDTYDAERDGVTLETHNMDPARVLRFAASLGAVTKRVFLVGCEPAPLDPDVDLQVELSEPVQAAVDEAILLVESLVGRLLREGGM